MTLKYLDDLNLDIRRMVLTLACIFIEGSPKLHLIRNGYLYQKGYWKKKMTKYMSLKN